jgi:general secretion pathway protein K
MASENRHAGRRGSIFVITLWTLLLLSSLALSLGVVVRQKVSLIARLSDRDNLYFITQAGINRAIAELRFEDLTPTYDSLSEGWANNPAIFKEVPMGIGSYTVGVAGAEGSMRYGLVDEESKININKADVDILVRLLQHAGRPSEEAEELAYHIKDWADADSFFQHPRYGAEDSDYKNLDDPYEAKDADFEIIDELLLVKDMDETTFERIKGLVTVYGQGGVNINTATAEVLQIIGLDERLIELVLSFRKGEDLTEGTVDDKVFAQPTGIAAELSQYYPLAPSEVAQISNLASQGQLVTRADYFMIRSVGQLSSGGDLEIQAVVDRQGQVQYWRERY